MQNRSSGDFSTSTIGSGRVFLDKLPCLLAERSFAIAKVERQREGFKQQVQVAKAELADAHSRIDYLLGVIGKQLVGNCSCNLVVVCNSDAKVAFNWCMAMFTP